MDISRLIVYVQEVGKEKLRDREEFINNKDDTMNYTGQQKGDASHSSFHKQNGPTPSFASALAPRIKYENHCQNLQTLTTILSESKGSVAQGGSSAPTYVKYCTSHPTKFSDRQKGCFK